MPEAAIDEHRNLCWSEDQVGSASNSGQWTRIYSIPKACRMDKMTQC